MQDVLKKIPMTLSRIGLGVVAGLLILVMLFLFLAAMAGTVDMNLNNDWLENVDFLTDAVGLNILWLALFVILGVGLIHLLSKLNWIRHLTVSRLSWGLGAWIAVMGSLWVVMSMSSPTHDSLIVTRAGVAAALGNYEHLSGDYFVRFPFQLGYVLWTELWARLFGLNEHSYLFMEFVNVACLAAGEMAMVRLTERLFGKREVTLIATLMLALFIQPVIFCTFLYGTMPGFCFAAWAILLLVRFLVTDRWRFLVGSGICVALAVTLKLNNMILLVAMVLILLVHLLRGKWLRALVGILVLVTLTLTVRSIPVWQYEARTDTDFGEGIPMISWMAMGLNDAVTAPGWYSYQYTIGNFNAAGKDPDKAAESSVEEIKHRIDFFVENPDEAKKFFSDKILSQWNEPSFQSLWNNQVRGQYMEKFGFAAYACGEGEGKVKSGFDLGLQLIYFGTLLAVVWLLITQIKKNPDRKAGDTALYLIPVWIIGGFIYHALFEAKSQYVITYVAVMIPYAAWGLAQIAACIKAQIPRLVTAWRSHRSPQT